MWIAAANTYLSILMEGRGRIIVEIGYDTTKEMYSFKIEYTVNSVKRIERKTEKISWNYTESEERWSSHKNSE